MVIFDSIMDVLKQPEIRCQSFEFRDPVVSYGGNFMAFQNTWSSGLG